MVAFLKVLFMEGNWEDTSFRGDRRQKGTLPDGHFGDRYPPGFLTIRRGHGSGRAQTSSAVPRCSTPMASAAIAKVLGLRLAV